MESHAASRSLPRRAYVADDVFSREMESLLLHSWQYAGHESQLPGPGAFLAHEFADESLLLTRDDDGELHALFNVCRHRGSRVCDAVSGATRRFVCPYHQWVYELDGRLAGAPLMPPEFRRDEHGLRHARIECWEGLLFVNVWGKDAPSVASLLADRAPAVRQFELPSSKIARTVLYDIAANWKLVLENFLECYHCSVSHREFCRVIDLKGLVRSHGHEARLREGMRSLTIDGEFVSSKLLGAYGRGEPPLDYTQTDWGGFRLSPLASGACFPDYAIVFAFQPVAPLRTRVRCDWLVAAHAEAGRDYNPDELIALWDVTNQQDWILCERNQRGVLSRAYEPGPHSPVAEAQLDAFLEHYASTLGVG